MISLASNGRGRKTGNILACRSYALHALKNSFKFQVHLNGVLLRHEITKETLPAPQLPV